MQTHPGYICLEVTIELKVGKREAIEEVIRERRKRRIESQPLEYPSAGSVFRNPEGMYAGELIEKSNLKVVNYKNASSSDIKYLIDLAHDKVLEEYGINMKIEQEFVNWE